MEKTLIAEITPTTDEPFSVMALKDIIELFEDEGWTGVEIKRDHPSGNAWSVYANADSDPYTVHVIG